MAPWGVWQVCDVTVGGRACDEWHVPGAQPRRLTSRVSPQRAQGEMGLPGPNGVPSEVHHAVGPTKEVLHREQYKVPRRRAPAASPPCAG